MSIEESNPIDYEMVVQAAFDKLLSDYLSSNHRKHTEPIIKAFRLANAAHKGVKRRSGEPYILHPIAVASIACSEMGLGSTSITAALLHDVVEDTEYTVEDIRDMFGDSIARIVDGLTKLSGEILVEVMTETNNTSGQLENIRRLLVTSTQDIRILLVKIADRLHNMRTLDSMPETKQSKIAAETRLFYAPLAERLGMYAIMEELQDLSLQYIHPEEYREVHDKISQTYTRREGLFDKFYEIIKPDLDATGLTYEIQHRIKSTYSIWNKMQAKGLPLEEIYDVFAIRIVFEPETDRSEYADCFRIYHVLTSHFALKDDRTRDWLTHPKPNGYRALHITVMGPTGEWVEVQIRSRQMHEMAERGLAAHWRYKTHSAEEVDPVEEQILSNVHTLLNNPGPSASDDYETMMYKFANQDMLIFTRKGERIRCPQDFTVLDFAYQLDPELGRRCIGAKVNHEMVDISAKLQNGDQVEILTTENTEPKESWLQYATSPTTKRYITDFLHRQEADQIEAGRKAFVRFAEGRGYDPEHVLPEDEQAPVLSYPSRDQFFLAVNRYEVRMDHALMKHLIKARKEARTRTQEPTVQQREDSDETKVPTVDPGRMKEIYTLRANDGIRNYIRATCCRPVYGEEVHGIINEQRQPVVHLTSCPKAIRLKATYGDDIVAVRWGPHIHSNFGITLEFTGNDSPTFLDDLIDIVREMHIPVIGIHVDSIHGSAIGSIHVRVRDRSERDEMMRRMQGVLGLLKIRQIFPEYSEQRRGIPIPNQKPFIPHK